MKFNDFIWGIEDNLHSEFSSIGSIWDEHVEAEFAYNSWRRALDLADEEELTPAKRVELLKGLYESLEEYCQEEIDNMPMGDNEIWEIFSENRDACESAFSDNFSICDCGSISDALYSAVYAFLKSKAEERIYDMRSTVWDMIAEVEE